MASAHFYILYIEDDREDRDIFTEALLSLDKKVTCYTANDGKAALTLLSDGLLIMPDLIFSDINMPVMNGKEFLETIKQIPRLRSIPVIMYSTTTHPDDRIKFLALGAEDVLSKPSSFAELVYLLQSLISKKENAN